MSCDFFKRMIRFFILVVWGEGKVNWERGNYMFIRRGFG